MCGCVQNEETNGESTNQELDDKPVVLPEGWKEEKDEKGEVCYVNEDNTQTVNVL